MRILRLTFLFTLIGGSFWLSSCKSTSGAEPSIEEAQLKLLAGTGTKTWTTSQVRFGAGNTDRTSEYSGMKITIKGTFSSTATSYSYEVTGKPSVSPWSTSGTWAFDSNDPESVVIRLTDKGGNTENLPITYSITQNQLQLNFTYSGGGYDQSGRVSAVEGTWIFLFTSN